MEKLYKTLSGSFLLYSGSYDFDNDLNPFQVNNNFFYLTNIDIPNFTVLYNHKYNKCFYFFEYKNSIWFDNENYIKHIHEQVHDINNIMNYIDNLDIIYSLDNFNDLNDKLKHKIRITHNLKMIDDICHENRVIKTEKEIDKITLACSYSSDAITNIIKNIKKLNNEKEIVSLFKVFTLGNYNVDKMSYLPICSNGTNNSILHYTSNNNTLMKKNLILLDIGCKYENYCSDITRTFPKSGKFTIKQKIIYSIVLECQKFAIKKLKHNVDWYQLQSDTKIKMYQLLLKEKLVYNTENKIEQNKIVDVFMPHSLGHTLGLDVHDTKPNGNLHILKKNMVITIEPGIYFIEHLLEKNEFINQNEIKKYINIGGIRIEDTILINELDCKVLSNSPKEIIDIETIYK